jgi:hypothetical protein
VTTPSRLRLRVALVLGLLLVLGGAAVASAATLFPGAAGANQAGPSVDHRGSERQTLSIPTGSLTPGDTVRGRHVVANGASQSVRYSLSSASTNDDGKSVRDVFQVTIRLADPASGAAATCEAFDGQILYDGPLGASTAGFGDAQMGSQAGDRPLASGQSETLCFEITMPSETGNEYQGATTATEWTIATEQDAGNP